MVKKNYNCKYLEINKSKNNFKLNVKTMDISLELKKEIVLVKNIFSSINYRDLLAFEGNIGVARRFPYVPGVDFVGTIIKSSSKIFLKGDRVAAFAIPNNEAFPGAWSNYCKIHSKNLFKIPKQWNLEDVISVGTAGLAAASGVSSIIRNSEVKKKKIFSFLVTGATGGVGSIACLLGKILGWNVVALTRDVKKNRNYLKSIGVKNVMSTKEFLSSPSMHLLNPEYDAIMECLGGTYLRNSVKKLKNNGVCAVAGLIDSQDLSGLSVLPFLMRGVCLVGTGSEVLNHKKRSEAFKLIGKLIKSRYLKKIRKKIYFNQVNNCLEQWSKSKNKGRVIIKN